MKNDTHSQANFLILSVVIVLFVLQGCTSFTIPVKQNSLVFQEREEKIPLNIGVFLSDEVRNYVITERYQGADWNFQIGEALEPSAVTSLQKIFITVSVIHDTHVGSNIDRIVSLKFGPSSKFQHGWTSWAEHSATVELICEIYDRKWNLLWKGDSLETVSGTTGAKEAGAFLITVFASQAVHNKIIGKTMNKSLTAALEQLNDQILTSGRDIIKRVSKI